LLILQVYGDSSPLAQREEGKKRVAVVEFQNKSSFCLREYGEVGEDLVGRLVAEGIAFNLGKEENFQVVGPEIVLRRALIKLGLGKESFSDPQVARQVGRILGVEVIIYGEVKRFEIKRPPLDLNLSKGEGKMVAKAYLVDAGSGVTLKSIEVKGGGEDVARSFKRPDEGKIIRGAIESLSFNLSCEINAFFFPLPTKEVKTKEGRIRDKLAQVLSLYSEGIDCYNKRDFETCVSKLSEMLEIDPENLFAKDARRYLQRAEAKLKKEEVVEPQLRTVD